MPSYQTPDDLLAHVVEAIEASPRISKSMQHILRDCQPDDLVPTIRAALQKQPEHGVTPAAVRESIAGSVEVVEGSLSDGVDMEADDLVSLAETQAGSLLALLGSNLHEYARYSFEGGDYDRIPVSRRFFASPSLETVPANKRNNFYNAFAANFATALVHAALTIQEGSRLTMALLGKFAQSGPKNLVRVGGKKPYAWQITADADGDLEIADVTRIVMNTVFGTESPQVDYGDVNTIVALLLAHGLTVDDILEEFKRPLDEEVTTSPTVKKLVTDGNAALVIDRFATLLHS